jgi:hypothetical protein
LDGSVFLDVLGAGIGGVVGDGGIGVDGADRLVRLVDVDAWLRVSEGTSSIERTIVAIVVVLSVRRCGHVL